MIARMINTNINISTNNTDYIIDSSEYNVASTTLNSS